MTAATKADIERIYDKLEPIAADVASIKTRLDLTPNIPDRPCTQLTEHLDEHKDTVMTWKKSAVRAAVDLVKLATVALVTWLFVKHR